MAQARSLHEILTEPQEPFYVDTYLLERGYSANLLEAQQGLSFCWPRHNATKNQLRLKTEDFTRKKGTDFRGGFLSKFLYRKFVKKATTCEKKALKEGDRSQTRELFLNSCCLSEESGSETKKHSPVSVLEMHSYVASSSDSNDKEKNQQSFLSLIDSPKKAFNILEELLKLAYEPSTNYISEVTQNDSKEHKAIVFEDWDSNSDESTTDGDESSLAIEREAFEAIREIVISEFAKFMTNWDKSEFDMSRELGGEIGNVILDDIMEELILEFLKANSTSVQLKVVKSDFSK